MSKFGTIKTSMKDGKLLIEALSIMGLKGIKNFIGNPQQLEGYEGRFRNERADIIVPRQYVGHASNDLGFRRNPITGMFEAIISDFDSNRFNARWLQNLQVEYNQADIAVKMKIQGWKLVNTGIKANGNRKLAYQPI